MGLLTEEVKETGEVVRAGDLVFAADVDEPAQGGIAMQFVQKPLVARRLAHGCSACMSPSNACLAELHRNPPCAA